MSEFDLIDRVARDMTEADPPGDFRVRVIERLPDARPQSWWQLGLLAGAGVAAGVLIMVSASMWNRQATPSAPAHTASSGTRTTTPVRSSSGPDLPIVINRGGNLSGTRTVGTAEPVAPEIVEPPFPFLSLVPIQPGELSIAPIVVGPLVNGPLTVTPIEVRPGGGRQK